MPERLAGARNGMAAKKEGRLGCGTEGTRPADATHGVRL